MTPRLSHESSNRPLWPHHGRLPAGHLEPEPKSTPRLTKGLRLGARARAGRSPDTTLPTNPDWAPQACPAGRAARSPWAEVITNTFRKGARAQTRRRGESNPSLPLPFSSRVRRTGRGGTQARGHTSLTHLMHRRSTGLRKRRQGTSRALPKPPSAPRAPRSQLTDAQTPARPRPPLQFSSSSPFLRHILTPSPPPP